MKLLPMTLLLLLPLTASAGEAELDAQDIANCQAKHRDPDHVAYCIDRQEDSRRGLLYLWSYVKKRPESAAVWRHCMKTWPGKVEGHDWPMVSFCIKGSLYQERSRRNYLEGEYGYEKVVDGDITWHIYGLKKYSSAGVLCNRDTLESEWECE